MSGNRLGELRKSRDLRQVDIASLFKVTERTVARWEKEGGIPDKQKIALAEYFEVSISWLMGWPESNGDGNDGQQEQAA